MSINERKDTETVCVGHDEMGCIIERLPKRPTCPRDGTTLGVLSIDGHEQEILVCRVCRYEEPIKTPAERLADIACQTKVPQGFGEYVDGTDGERIGTNVALWVQWRDFFVELLRR